MYNLNITKKTSDSIFFAIEKYHKKYGTNKIKKHFNIEIKQFENIHQQMDTGGVYKTFDEMYSNYNKEVGTCPNINIDEQEYKNTILLLLSFYKNIIEF